MSNRKALAIDQEATPIQQSLTYIIYKRGLETVAQKYDGSNPIHNTIADAVIQSALNDPGPLDNPSLIFFASIFSKLELFDCQETIG